MRRKRIWKRLAFLLVLGMFLGSVLPAATQVRGEERTIEDIKNDLKDAMKRDEQYVVSINESIDQFMVVVDKEIEEYKNIQSGYDENTGEESKYIVNWYLTVYYPAVKAFHSSLAGVGYNPNNPSHEQKVDDFRNIPHYNGENTIDQIANTHHIGRLAGEFRWLYSSKMVIQLGQEAIGLISQYEEKGIDEAKYNELIENLKYHSYHATESRYYIEEVYNYLKANHSTDDENQLPSIIEGNVIDKSNNEYIEGAFLVLGDVSAVSYKDGHYKAVDVKPGMVPVYVSYEGYEDFQTTYEVPADRHIKGVDVYMTPLPETIEKRNDTESNWDNDDEDGYKEEKKKAGPPIGGILVVGGMVGGAGLLLYKNGLKKNKNYNKATDKRYQQGLEREKNLKKANYKDKYVESIDKEEQLLEKQRQEQLSKMKRDRSTIAENIGKGVKKLTEHAKSLGKAVEKATDYLNDRINDLRSIKLGSIGKVGINVGNLLDLAGADPFKKFRKFRDAIKEFNNKNLVEWVKKEVRKSLSVAKVLVEKLDMVKGYEKMIDGSKFKKEYQRFNNLQKNIRVLEKVMDDPSYLDDPNLKAKIKTTREGATTLNKSMKDVANTTEKKIEKAVKKQLDKQVKQFEKGIDGK